MPVGPDIRNAQLSRVGYICRASRLQQAAYLPQTCLGVHNMFNHIAACNQIKFPFAGEKLIGKEVADLSLNHITGGLQVQSPQSAECVTDFDAGSIVAKACESSQESAICEANIQIRLTRRTVPLRSFLQGHPPISQLLHKSLAADIGREGVFKVGSMILVTG